MHAVRYFIKLTPSYLLALLGIFFVYIFAGKLGLSFAFVNASASAIWAPTGIAIAVMLLLGLRVWPAIFLGAFIVNLTTQGGVATSLGIALGNTLEGVVAAYFITKFANGKYAFDRTITVSKFTGFVLLATMVSATIGDVTLLLGGYTQPQNYWMVWFTWWFGDIGGALIVAPLIIVYSIHAIRASLQFNFMKILQILLFFLLIILISQSIFSGNFPFEYFVYPLLVWGAFRFGRREVTTAVFLIALIAVWNTAHGLGPFALPHDINRSLLRIAFFLSVTSYSMMSISAALLERKETRKALATSEKRFRALIEKSFDAIVLIDATSKISYASPSVTRVLGYTPEELVGTIGFDLVHPEDRKMTMGVLAKLILKPGEVVTVQYRTIRKDGSIIWVEATGTNLLFDTSVHAVVINFRDITLAKEDAEKLVHDKTEDDALLASIGEGMIATDEKGVIVLVNDATCDFLGYTRHELIGKSLKSAIPMQDGEGKTLPESERPIAKVLREHRKIITSPHNYYIRADKTKMPVRFTVTPVILEDKLVGTIEVFRDITQETEIDKAKSEFVSLASHQLRTPLTTINWYIERLTEESKQKGIPTKEKRYLHEIYHASARMVNLVNSLLNVSRLELGTFITEPKDLSYGDLIKQSIKDASSMYLLHKRKVVLHIPQNIPPIKADAKLLGIIVQNLVSNALKYSKEGGEVIVSLRYDKSGFVLEVKDFGYGIEKKDQSKIFTKLFRAENAKALDQDGSGLGLYMVKFITDTAGGKISFTSEENKGTTFVVKFPKTGMKKKEGTKQLR